MVYGVYAIELVQTIFVTAIMFKGLAVNFGNTQDLDEIGPIWPFVVPILGATGVLLSIYFDSFRLLTSKSHSGICGANLLCI